MLHRARGVLLQVKKLERKSSGTLYRSLTARLGVANAAPENGKRKRTASWPGIRGHRGVKRGTARAPRTTRRRTATDLWDALEDHLDPAKLRPKLADSLEIKHFQARTGDYMMICNTKELTHFRFEPGDAELI